MKKIVIEKPGGYERLKIVEEKGLIPREDEVLVDVHAFGVNYADIIIRWGLYESAKQLVGWPITPGFEFSGTVRSTGERVFGVSLFNAYASEILAKPHQLFSLPSHLSLEEAAGFPAVMMTAYHALLQNVVVRPGMTALIHSAAGGVGSALVQLCRIKGIHTIGVVGSSHKVEALRELGCEMIIDKSKEDLWKRVEAFAPKGVDLAFDANGVETLKESYNHLAPTGKLIAYGAHSMFPKHGGKVNWPKLAVDWLRTPRFNPLDMTSANKGLVTFNLSFLFERKDLLSEAMTDLLKWTEGGKLKAPKVTVYPLEKIAEAHRDLESGQTVGKLVIKVGGAGGAGGA